MATSTEYIQYVMEQISGCGETRYKKMFGEYMVYVNDKPILLVCDDTVFVKQIDALRDLMKDADVGFPYTGAKEHYILDIDDAELSNDVIRVLEPITSVPSPKKKKSKK